jgi:hypothetical protein
MSEERNTEDEFLKELAPELMAFKESKSEDPPEGYFEGFTDPLMDKLKSEKRPEAKVISLINVRNFAIAAALALILASIPFLKTYLSDGNNPQNTGIQLSALTLSDSSAAEEIFIDGYDDELIYETIDEDELADIPLSDEWNGEIITEYLMEADIENELIIESL